MAIKVEIKKLHPDAVIPYRAINGDAGLDLTAISKEWQPIHGEFDSPKSEGYHYMEYGTGLAVAIPKGHVGLLFPRSSISKTELILANSVGVIDSGYRGEIKIRFKMYNLRSGISYKVGERIAQLIVIPYPQIYLEEVEELDQTERGEGGFGSTNK